jgi:hypothetical protein
VEHLGLEPSSTSLQGRSADPARAPIGLAWGARPLCFRVQRSDGEMGLTPTDGVMVPGVGFEPTSPRLQRGAFTRLASQAELNVVRPTGIEPVSARWHRAALPLSYGRPRNGAQSRTRTCEAHRHLIYSQASLPLEYLCAMDGAGNRKDRPYLLLAEG